VVALTERIIKYARDGSGYCRLRVDVGHPGIEVSVVPNYAPGGDQNQHQVLADRIAVDIADSSAVLTDVRRELAHSQAAMAELQERFDRLTTRWRSAMDNIKALTSSKHRRLNGRTRVRITERGVWLLDWEKDSRGFGLWYETIADLWREWPELRPVACGQDEDSPWMEVVSQPIVEKT
jgi:hypothetical protein